MKHLFNFKLIIISIISVLFILFSCRLNQSTSNQITKKQLNCTTNEINKLTYTNKYSSYFTGYFKDEAIAAISQVPEPYLDFVFNKYKIKVNIVSSHPSKFDKNVDKYDSFFSPEYQRNICGITYFASDKSPGNIKTTVTCFLHELGHDSFYFLQTKNKNFTQALKNTANIVSSKYREKASDYVNSSGFDIDETLAELFRTWYCSQEARELLKQDMPEVYTFATNYLLPPDDPAYLGKKKDINVYVKKTTNNSLVDIYISNNTNSNSIKYCIGSTNKCNLQELKTTTVTKQQAFIISSVSVDELTENNAIHIYDTQSTPKLLRSFYIQKR